MNQATEHRSGGMQYRVSDIATLQYKCVCCTGKWNNPVSGRSQIQTIDIPVRGKLGELYRAIAAHSNFCDFGCSVFTDHLNSDYRYRATAQAAFLEEFKVDDSMPTEFVRLLQNDLDIGTRNGLQRVNGH